MPSIRTVGGSSCSPWSSRSSSPILFSYLVATDLTRPLRTIASAVDRVSAGDLSTPDPGPGRRRAGAPRREPQPPGRGPRPPRSRSGGDQRGDFGRLGPRRRRIPGGTRGGRGEADLRPAGGPPAPGRPGRLSRRGGGARRDAPAPCGPARRRRVDRAAPGPACRHSGPGHAPIRTCSSCSPARSPSRSATRSCTSGSRRRTPSSSSSTRRRTTSCAGSATTCRRR